MDVSTRALPAVEIGRLGCLRVDELRSFLVVAEELHIARAAQRLHLHPSALSRRIRNAERACGAALLERTTRRVRLTPYGHAVAALSRRWLADMDLLASQENAS